VTEGRRRCDQHGRRVEGSTNVFIERLGQREVRRSTCALHERNRARMGLTATSASITQCARINPSSIERRMKCTSANSTPDPMRRKWR